jgi:hypothetical protein
VPELLRGLQLFLHPRAAVVPHPAREAVSLPEAHRGVAAAEAAAAQRVRPLHRRGTRRPQVVAEAATRTDAKQFPL